MFTEARSMVGFYFHYDLSKMKLRIRYNIEKHLIQFDDDVKTINDLRNVISAKVRNLPLDFF